MYQELDIQLKNEIRKKFIRALRLILKYTDQSLINSIVIEMMEKELKLRTNRGIQRSAPSLDLRWVTDYLALPWYRVSIKAVELLSQISGTTLGIPIPGGGVILLDDRQFINDYLTLLTKGPGFRILGLPEEEYLKLVQLSLGPKSVFLGKQS